MQHRSGRLVEFGPPEPRLRLCGLSKEARPSRQRAKRSDQEVSPEEKRLMEEIVAKQGEFAEEQAIIVVQMAKMQSTLFSGIEDYVVTREFNGIATREQKLALLHCLFAVSAANHSISNLEDAAIRQIARELKLTHKDYIDVRLDYRDHLDVLKDS